jgi:CRP/FNR family transcriptional regulator, cyclic AMP receptor protein
MVDLTRTRNRDGHWEVTWKFEDDSFETLRTIAEEHSYKAGMTVFKEGDQPDGMYLILQGTAKIIRRSVSGEDRLIGTTREGQSFGEIGLLVARPRHATVQAETDLRCLKITRLVLDLMHNSAPDMAYMMYQVLARSLAEQLLTTQEMQRPE